MSVMLVDKPGVCTTVVFKESANWEGNNVVCSVQLLCLRKAPIWREIM